MRRVDGGLALLRQVKIVLPSFAIFALFACFATPALQQKPGQDQST